jgi:hypothetical protein
VFCCEVVCFNLVHVVYCFMQECCMVMYFHYV